MIADLPNIFHSDTDYDNLTVSSAIDNDESVATIFDANSLVAFKLSFTSNFSM